MPILCPSHLMNLWNEQIKHQPSKWVTLQPYWSHEKREEGGPKQRHALFECPCNTEDEEEGEERVLVALGPEIGRFGEYCTGPFRRTVRSQQKRGHQRTFMLGERHETCADRWRRCSSIILIPDEISV
jgi:hypothetical protein